MNFPPPMKFRGFYSPPPRQPPRAGSCCCCCRFCARTRPIRAWTRPTAPTRKAALRRGGHSLRATSSATTVIRRRFVFDLANAEFKVGHIGAALLEQLRARLATFAPGDPDINHNLQIARKQVSASIPIPIAGGRPCCAASIGRSGSASFSSARWRCYSWLADRHWLGAEARGGRGWELPGASLRRFFKDSHFHLRAGGSFSSPSSS